MTNDLNVFREVQETISEIGTAKKFGTLKAEGVGVVEMKSCILNKVLYVSALKRNLLSVSINCQL